MMQVSGNAGASGSSAAFSRGAAAALVAGGFALFLALAFFMGQGENALADPQNGGGHAGANGLNGYAGLVRLVEGAGYDAARTRNPKRLETRGVLVLTPPLATDPDALGALLDQRRRFGPTLVILPKWRASLPPGNLPPEAAGAFKRGWVVLAGAQVAEWTAQLPAPYRFTHTLAQAPPDTRPRWQGMGLAGTLPSAAAAHAAGNPAHETLIRDAAGKALAVRVRGHDAGHGVILLAEPDLANNWGLAQPARAAAAMALIAALDTGGTGRVTFDLTLNGFGASENLLSLAFRPPFLAATLCLIMALAIVFWRALLQFGPAASSGDPGAAFGKAQLVTNGAGLILRARRWPLLARPYAALMTRRTARMLGLARPDRAGIDAALAQRLPAEEPFSRQAARLEAARTPAEILSAAAALDTLARKLTQ